MKRALGRPGLLWAAQIAAYAFLLFVSLPRFADLPLTDVAFHTRSLDELVKKLNLVSRHYRAMALNAGTATLMVAALEAWRRRLHRKRQFQERTQALVSLALALPLYLLAAAELLLLPIGHGLLWLPTRRELLVSTVTFKSSARYAELRGASLRLVDFRSTVPDAFYCPQGARTWTVRDEDVESLADTTRRPLAQLLGEFTHLTQCRLPGRTP